MIATHRHRVRAKMQNRWDVNSFQKLRFVFPEKRCEAPFVLKKNNFSPRINQTRDLSQSHRVRFLFSTSWRSKTLPIYHSHTHTHTHTHTRIHTHTRARTHHMEITRIWQMLYWFVVHAEFQKFIHEPWPGSLLWKNGYGRFQQFFCSSTTSPLLFFNKISSRFLRLYSSY